MVWRPLVNIIPIHNEAWLDSLRNQTENVRVRIIYDDLEIQPSFLHQKSVKTNKACRINCFAWNLNFFAKEILIQHFRKESQVSVICNSQGTT